ncbi:hypothetical protein [Massilia sp. CF038]|uniref:hypothetical protein n=1 Tax=Massilia sp. CF038 TaxID=1881045 RepID=UPI000933789C|nr:hypothetical protein [Massilia sp. CF038]
MHLHALGKTYEEWNRCDISRTTRQTEVVSSAPGRIVSGGALSISADNILNRDSHILAGGTLSIAAGVLNNESTTGQLMTRTRARSRPTGLCTTKAATRPATAPSAIRRLSRFRPFSLGARGHGGQSRQPDISQQA